MTTPVPPDTGETAREALLAGLPVAARRLELAGVSTFLLEGGAGAPLVLLHGPAGSAVHWARVIPALARTHRVIVPDLPGHGASVVADGTLGREHVLAWLDALLTETCPAPPALVGYALGGAVAARFAAAAEQGDRVGRLVLVDALGLTDFAPAPEFGGALQAFFADPAPATHDELWRQCAFDLDGLRADPSARWEPFRSYNVDRACSPGVLAALGDLMAEFGAPAIAAAELARIRVPTTLIWGRHDLATPLAAAERASVMHGWPLHVIERCADDPPIERPQAFTSTLRAALADFAGELIMAGHPRYNELRAVYNGLVDRRPALIARCTGARDVAAAIGLAQADQLPISVYGGGHNVTGNAVCDDGVTIDLRPMKGIEMDPDARTCRAEAGLTWGELDAATQAHGLAVTGGRISTTGVSGLTLGGGSGWIERKCGFAVDNLLAAEIVTADGRIRTVSQHKHPDLFWGTRGGGGNLGVATRFHFRLHPIGPTVLGGLLVYPAPMAAAVLRNFRAAMAEAPDEVGAGVVLLTAPHTDFVPEPVRGQPVAGVVLCYAGPLDEAEAGLRPLRAFGPPALDTVAPMPYVELQRLVDGDYPSGLRNYWTGDFLSGLPDQAIELLCRFHLIKPSPRTQILLLPGGGATTRVPDGTMAIGQREAPFNLHITSLWTDPDDDVANIAWTRAFSAAIRPHTTGRVYVNFIGDEGPERVVASFGAEGYARLQALKNRYDPSNLFRTSQNVRPTAQGRPT
jgi:FAD/FMN-containing dehydrogenase/pimeloyl-ACP methyl ester carboxylesterase